MFMVKVNMGRLALGTLVLFLLMGVAGAVFAQQPSSSASQPAAPATPEKPQTANPQSAPEQPQGAPGKPQGSVAPINEGHERIVGVVPQFGVTNRQDAPPLTKKQKFVLFARAAYDPFVFVAVGLQAGVSQAENEFPGYGQGAAGYGKRFGATLADQTSSNFFSNFAYPVLFKQDPRYFRLGQGSIKRRIGYSIVQEFSAKSDAPDRHRMVNWSNIFGAFTAGSISNAYYPSSDRGFGLTMSRSAISLGYGTLGGLVSEFWPDINRKLFHKQPKTPAAAQDEGTPQSQAKGQGTATTTP
jgi:hypothetical protein